MLPLHPPAPKALPFSFNASAATHPDGRVLGADSHSLLEASAAGAAPERIFPVSGEIHLARVPAAQWREQLLRMRGGGLDTVAVYVFWIHHEEARGQFTFDGRRNVSAFLGLAAEVGLRVLLRIGPWDHGEARNGGHPDWVLSSCGRLRSSDDKYLACVGGWYFALAAQLRGHFWSQAGPVVAVQVDNETSDWRYLLALRALALQVGMAYHSIALLSM